MLTTQNATPTVKLRNLALSGLAAGGLISLIVVSLVIMTGPFFGNMDDTNFLTIVESDGPWAFPTFYGDPATGFLRNASWFVSYPAYWIANIFGATSLYIVNGLIVIFIAVVVAAVALTALNIRRAPLLLGFVGAFFIWPYTADLFAFPSLQEKTVILSAALLLWWATKGSRLNSGLISYTLLTLISMIAFTSKAPIILFVPALTLALLYKFKRSEVVEIRFRLGTAVILWVSCTLFLLYLTLTSNYSAGTAGQQGISFTVSKSMLLLVFVNVVYSMLLIIRVLARKKLSYGTPNYAELLPLLWLITITLSGFVWEWRNYYLSIAALPFAMMVLVVINWIPVRKWRNIVILMLLLTSASWLTIRLPMFFEATNSFDRFLDSSIAQRLNAEGKVIYVGCAEAPWHFNRYAVERGLDGIQFDYIGSLDSDARSTNFFLSDSRLCPISFVNQFEPVWRTSSDSSYVLYRD